MKKLTSLLLIIALLLSLAACGGSDSNTAGSPAASEPPAPDTAITVIDMLDREITLSQPATRVVALTAADCEILYALGAGDTLVGRGEYCDWPVEVLDVPSVESGFEANIEQIISLQPQVLLMSSMAQTEEQVAALEKAGIHVVVSNADNIADTYEAITMIGTLMGKDAEAEALVGEMKATFADLQAKAAGDGSKSIYFEVSPLQWGLWAAGNNTFMDEIAQMLGVRNIFPEVNDWGEVSEEQVIQRVPDYIVTVTMYYGDGPTPEEEIASRPGWENIPAVQNGAILNLQNNELSRPGPRLTEGAQMLYDFLYGEN